MPTPTTWRILAPLRTTLATILILGCATSPPTAPAPGAVGEENRTPANREATDAGIVFHDDVPRVADDVGEFRKLYTREYPDPALGTLYPFEDPGGLVMEVFIYPIGPGPALCDSTCQQIGIDRTHEQFIEALPELVRLGKYSSATPIADTTAPAIRETPMTRLAVAAVGVNGGEGYTYQLLQAFDGSFVKVRATITGERDDDRVLGFAEELQAALRPRYTCPLGRYRGQTIHTTSEFGEPLERVRGAVERTLEEGGFEIEFSAPRVWTTAPLTERVEILSNHDGEPYPGFTAMVRLTGAPDAPDVTLDVQPLCETGASSDEQVMALTLTLWASATLGKHLGLIDEDALPAGKP